MCLFCKKLDSYFKKHAVYNAVTHMLIGLGVGILLARPLVGPHPVRWGLGLLVLGLVAHLYPLMVKK